MPRKSTRFAFPGKCDFLGAIGSTKSAKSVSLSNDVNAMAPTLLQHSWKKYRRVICFKDSLFKFSLIIGYILTIYLNCPPGGFGAQFGARCGTCATGVWTFPT